MKKGFTLVELLAVIAIIAVLAIIAVPNVIKIFNEGTTRFMEEQGKLITAAADIYVRDYCDKVNMNSSIYCPYYYATYDEGNKYLCLSDLQAAGLVDNPLSFKDSNCKGIIKYTSSGKETYLYCGSEKFPEDAPANNLCN